MSELIEKSFAKIAPFWPLKNLIAVNPLQGFEDLPIEEALKVGAAYFEQSDLPKEMLSVNLETIKWMGAYCDEGQATISMPLREYGLYHAWKALACYDKKLHKNRKENIGFLKSLPEKPEQVIAECFIKLGITEEEQQIEFLSLLLTTLPGWASYVKYSAEYAKQQSGFNRITQLEYLAIRVIITRLFWPDAKNLLNLQKRSLEQSNAKRLQTIENAENAYRVPLLKKLAAQKIKKPYTTHTPEAQFVFCIDVRSEPFRKALESTGDYQTVGFAGFFGIPVQITDNLTGLSYASCPVLLKAQHDLLAAPCDPKVYLKYKKSYELKQTLKRIYQSLKYTFSTPFALVEALGVLSGIWMGIRTLSPKLASQIDSIVCRHIDVHQIVEPLTDKISFEEKCVYAENALRMMGLTNHFAPMIVLCGHGSRTQNNAYATALDCGACGGRPGGSNAKILASILNCFEVKRQLEKNGLPIPEKTLFIAAEHNTTTDEVVLFCKHETQAIQQLKQDLQKARHLSNRVRLKKLGVSHFSPHGAKMRAHDWAQVRPEWGLARNAAFIIAPREMTASLDLEGRCFLHSYDYKQDSQGTFLTTILTAPMIVAEWINLQYLFSTMNNVAYGSGSKVTKNITGKIGIMQGNASDLMNGLPLQSVYQSDTKPYHEPQRLMVVVLAPKALLDKIISTQRILQKLFGNGWVQMSVIEPVDHTIHLLNRDFSWQAFRENPTTESPSLSD